MVNYDNLWKILIDKKLKKTELKTLAVLSPNTLAKLSKGETVAMESLIKICDTLDCSLSQIVEYIPERKNVKENKKSKKAVKV